MSTGISCAGAPSAPGLPPLRYGSGPPAQLCAERNVHPLAQHHTKHHTMHPLQQVAWKAGSQFGSDPAGGAEAGGNNAARGQASFVGQRGVVGVMHSAPVAHMPYLLAQNILPTLGQQSVPNTSHVAWTQQRTSQQAQPAPDTTRGSERVACERLPSSMRAREYEHKEQLQSRRANCEPPPRASGFLDSGRSERDSGRSERDSGRSERHSGRSERDSKRGGKGEPDADVDVHAQGRRREYSAHGRSTRRTSPPPRWQPSPSPGRRWLSAARRSDRSRRDSRSRSRSRSPRRER